MRCNIGGKESAGIVSSDGRELHLEKSMGLVADIFQPEVLARLPGDLALGAYAASAIRRPATLRLMNAQPIVIDCNNGQTCARPQRLNLAERGGNGSRTLEHQRLDFFRPTSDTEVIVHLVARSQARNLSGALADALNQVEGAYSLLVLTRDEMYALRDPRGFRLVWPLDNSMALGSLLPKRVRSTWLARRMSATLNPAKCCGSRARELSHCALPLKNAFAALHFRACDHFARPDSLVFGRVVWRKAARCWAACLRVRASWSPADIVVPVHRTQACLRQVGYCQSNPACRSCIWV